MSGPRIDRVDRLPTVACHACGRGVTVSVYVGSLVYGVPIFFCLTCAASIGAEAARRPCERPRVDDVAATTTCEAAQ